MQQQKTGLVVSEEIRLQRQTVDMADAVRSAVATFTCDDQLKRSIDGTHHHVSRQHLHRYLSEFDFRYNTHKVADGDRAQRTIRQAAGKRLAYRQPAAEAVE